MLTRMPAVWYACGAKHRAAVSADGLTKGEIMKRPASVARFEVLFIGTLVLGVVGSALQFEQFAALGGVGMVITFQAIILGLMLALVLWISRKRSNVGRWVLVALFSIGLPFSLPQIMAVLEMNVIAGVVMSGQLVLQVVALVFLFTAESRHWFSRDAREAEQVA